MTDICGNLKCPFYVSDTVCPCADFCPGYTMLRDYYFTSDTDVNKECENGTFK